MTNAATVAPLRKNSTLVSHKPTKPGIDASWLFHCDGSTLLSNPSAIGGWGFTVWADRKLYSAAHGQLLGEVTNNVAEFAAVHNALCWARKRGMMTPTILSDSRMVVDALLGRCEIRNDRCLRLLTCVKHSMQMGMSPSFGWVPRDDSQQAFTDFIAKRGCTFEDETHYFKLSDHELLFHLYGNG